MHRLTLQAKQDHIEKVVRTSDPLKGIAEFVWNGFDAQATVVTVDLRRTPLGGIDEIIIEDNGSGITEERADHDFAQLGDPHTAVFVISFVALVVVGMALTKIPRP